MGGFSATKNQQRLFAKYCALEAMAASLHRAPTPERIILCIDVADEVNQTNFSSRKVSRLTLIKTALRSFLDAKKRMNENHEYAICLLADCAIWFAEFTNDVDSLKRKIGQLEAQGKFDSFDMSSVFTALLDQDKNILKVKPENWVYRAIFIYSRSSTIPTYKSGNELAQQFIQCPWFYFDVVYLHHKPSKENRPQEIFDFLTDLESDAPGHCGYFFENSSNKAKVFSSIALLLAHPYQRPDQADLPVPDKKK